MPDDLLYLSPVIPDVTGNGLAMRAGVVLEALSAQYRVSLLVVPLYAPYGVPIPDAIGALCVRSAVLPSPLHTPPETTASLWAVIRQLFSPRQAEPSPDLLFAGVDFSVVHVFRLAALLYARPYRAQLPRARLHLDLDDLESITHRRLADLYRLNGLEERARAEEWVAERDRGAEDEAFAEADRVYVCSETDAAALRTRTTTEIVVLPNAVRPAPAIERPSSDHPFNLLFVGNMGYYPNEDAVRYLCHEILPALRGCAPRAFTLTIVGTGPEEMLAPLRSIPEVRVAGAVPDVTPYYQDADAVVVPLRAGGGTRIKVLEAFSFKRPVISTSIGVEGLAVEAGKDVLVADRPDEFARHCASLMEDRNLGEVLTVHAARLLNRAYTLDVVAGTIGALCSPPIPRAAPSDARPPGPR
jgi:polysaccharide biosynthesis protein PslH